MTASWASPKIIDYFYSITTQWLTTFIALQNYDWPLLHHYKAMINYSTTLQSNDWLHLQCDIAMIEKSWLIKNLRLSTSTAKHSNSLQLLHHCKTMIENFRSIKKHWSTTSTPLQKMIDFSTELQNNDQLLLRHYKALIDYFHGITRQWSTASTTLQTMIGYFYNYL